MPAVMEDIAASGLDITVHVQEGEAERHWEPNASGQWYDYSVTCSSDPAYYWPFAGRVENGQHTISDPYAVQRSERFEPADSDGVGRLAWPPDDAISDVHAADKTLHR